MRRVDYALMTRYNANNVATIYIDLQYSVSNVTCIVIFSFNISFMFVLLISAVLDETCDSLEDLEDSGDVVKECELEDADDTCSFLQCDLQIESLIPDGTGIIDFLLILDPCVTTEPLPSTVDPPDFLHYVQFIISDGNSHIYLDERTSNDDIYYFDIKGRMSTIKATVFTSVFVRQMEFGISLGVSTQHSLHCIMYSLLWMSGLLCAYVMPCSFQPSLPHSATFFANYLFTLLQFQNSFFIVVSYWNLTSVYSSTGEFYSYCS